MVLYAKGNELDKCFNKSVRVHVTLSSTTVMCVCLYQCAAPVREMYENHEPYMFSDIHKYKTRGKHAELLHRLFEISDENESRLLRDRNR